MNKFSLVIMATLCSLLISCNREEIRNDVSIDVQLSSRAATNPIKVVSTTFSGSPTIYFCTQANLSYANAQAVVDLTFYDNSSVSYTTTNATVTIDPSYTLAVTLDGNLSIETQDLYVEVCGAELCYEDSADSFSGTALDFIIDDVESGM